MAATLLISTPALRRIVLLTLLLAAGLLTSCRTTAGLPPVDVTEPGWTVRFGQAVWKPAAAANEIVGELILAVHPDGRSLVQFNKNPLPLLAARIEGDRWQLTHIPQQRVISGNGPPPAHAIWLHLASGSGGSPPVAPLQFQRPSGDQWSLSNPITGEVITVYLNP